MTHTTEKSPPLADHDMATMSGKVYNQLREAWERDRANAAPQMLEALIEAEKILWELQPNMATHQIVQAAIAKATGGI